MVTSMSSPPAFAPWRACGAMNSLDVSDRGGVISISQEPSAPLWSVDVPVVMVCNPQGNTYQWTLRQLLVDTKRIPRSVSYFGWIKDTGMNEDVYWILTTQNTRLEFDLRHGQLTRIKH